MTAAMICLTPASSRAFACGSSGSGFAHAAQTRDEDRQHLVRVKSLSVWRSERGSGHSNRHAPGPGRAPTRRSRWSTRIDRFAVGDPCRCRPTFLPPRPDRAGRCAGSRPRRDARSSPPLGVGAGEVAAPKRAQRGDVRSGRGHVLDKICLGCVAWSLELATEYMQRDGGDDLMTELRALLVVQATRW
jgi:hypothetical protein